MGRPNALNMMDSIDHDSDDRNPVGNNNREESKQDGDI